MSAYRLVILAILAAICALNSAASTVHHVRFSQPALLMVWEDDAFIGQGEHVNLTGFGAIENPALMGSGDLLQSHDTIGQSKTIKIASNTGFAIRVSNAATDQVVSVQIIEIGENAQANESQTIGDTATVFELPNRTALRSGAPETQTITLEIEWTGPTAPNLYVTAL